MYKLINSLIFCLALGFIGSLSAVPALTASLQPAIDKIDPPSTHHTFNVNLPIDDHFANLEARTKQKNDPSEKWQGWATVEIWTGGGSRKPVNFGDLRGRNLSTTMFELMDKQCPPSKWSSGRGRCTNDDWMEFYTNAVTKKDPWKVQLRPAWIRTNWAQWDNEAIRIVLMQIVADTLRQFTTLMPDFNCYDVDSPYWVKGTYCNVPQFIKVNLPDTSPFRDQPKGTVGNDGEPPKGNYWHLETWGANADQRWQFTEIGELKPCATRYMVDKVMDKYQNDIVKQFPDYKGKFTRDARVIINGDKVCSDEL